MKNRRKILTIPSVILISLHFFSAIPALAVSDFVNMNEENVGLVTQSAKETFGKNISARACVLYEMSNEEYLYEKNGDEQLPMASTTKIMTALVVFDICKLDEIVVIPSEAVGVEGSSAYLRAGDEYTVRELLYALLLQSANDAATALAIYAGGSVGGFADLMNARAESLGLKNTHFTNAHGLDDEEHFTTAKELAIIASELLKTPELLKIVSTYKKTFTYGERTRTYVNHNKMLLRYEGSIGMKTGYTKKSGRCLVGAAKRNGVTLICVTLDAPSDWNDQAALMDFGFETLECVTLCHEGDEARAVNIIGSDKESISVSAKENLVIIKKTYENCELKYIELPRYLIAPIKVGYTVGRLIYSVGEREYSVDLIATEDAPAIKESGFLKRIFQRK